MSSAMSPFTLLSNPATYAEYLAATPSKAILDRLKAITPSKFTLSICPAVKFSERYPPLGSDSLRIINDHLADAFESWPKFSGNLTYPISDQTSDLTPKEQFNTALNRDALWDNSTTYGQLRYELLAYLITYFSVKVSPDDKPAS